MMFVIRLPTQLQQVARLIIPVLLFPAAIRPIIGMMHS
jgi:hypothetical protein